MAGIGDSWGTKEELLHPRGPDGRWIRKAGIAKSAIEAVLGFLAAFRPRTFQNRGQASQYLQNTSRRPGARRMGRPDLVRLSSDLSPANADLRDGVIDEPSTKKFVDMMDRHVTELPDDVILTRIVGVDAFGFTPETAKGTDSNTDPGIRGMSGKLIAERGYGLTTLGGPEGPTPAGSVRMVIAAKKGTKVIIPAAGPNDTTVFTDREQPLRVTKVAPDGAGGWTMYVTADAETGQRDVPEPIGGPVGVRQPSKDRESRISESMQSLAKLDKVPDEEKERAQEQRNAEERAKMGAPVPSPTQEAERRRVEQLTQQPAPGEPAPRTEPPVGRVGEAPTAGAVPATPGAGAPEPTPVPRRAVDLRLAVRDAKIPAPAAGPKRRQFNEAYQGIISGKKDPIDAVRELDRDAVDLRAQGDDDAASFEQLSDLIKKEYGLEQPASAPEKRTAAGLPKAERPEPVKTKLSKREQEAQARNQEAAKETPPAPTRVKKAPAKAAKKAAPAGSLTEAQERAVVDRAKEFRGKERNDEERRIVAQADEILARRQRETPPAAASAKKVAKAPAAKKTLPPVAKKAAKKAVPVELTPEQRRDYTDLSRDEQNFYRAFRRAGNGHDDALQSARDAVAAKEEADRAEQATKALAKKAAPEAPGDDLDKMTKRDLIAEAGRRGVTARESWTKDRIKKEIRDREKLADESDEQFQREMREELEAEFENEAQLERTTRELIPEPAPVKKAAKAAAPALSGQENRIRELFEGDKPTVAQLRTYAREQGIDSKGGGEGVPLTRMNRDGLIKLILEEREIRERRGPSAPAPAKKVAPRGIEADRGRIPLGQSEAAPEFDTKNLKVGKGISATRIRPGDVVWVEPGKTADGKSTFLRTRRKTGSFPLTVTRNERESGNNYILHGTLPDGREISTAGYFGQNTFMRVEGLPEGGVPAPAKKAAKAAAPDKVQAARARQEEIFEAKRFADTAAELDQLITDEASDKAILARFDRATQNEGTGGSAMDVVRARLEAGDRDGARAEMRRILGANGVTPVGNAGDTVKYNPQAHQTIGGTGISEGDTVQIVRPGHRARIGGEDVELGRPVVERVDPAREKGPDLVPEGSVAGPRTETPVDNAPRKRELRQAWLQADVPTPPPGSGRKGHEEIKGDLVAGRITPEEAIRRYESEVAFNKEDLAEVDAHLRETDLAPAERSRVERHRAQLQSTIEAHEAQSTFLRDHFKEEAPVIGLKEAKVQDPESYEFLKDATPDDMREAAKEAGLDAPSGDTPDEMFTDLLKQVARRALEEKRAKKVPAKKAARKAAPPAVPRDKERVDARLLAEGIEGLNDRDIAEVQRALDGERITGTGKNPTPRQIAETLEFKARGHEQQAAILYGNWSPEDDPERAAIRQMNHDGEMARAQAFRDLAERLRGVRRKKAAAPAAKKAVPEVAKLQGKVDDLEKRRIDDALGELTGAKSKEQRDAALEGLTLPELRRLAEQAGVSHARTWRSKQGVREGIIAHFFPETPSPEAQAKVEGQREQAMDRLRRQGGIPTSSSTLALLNDHDNPMTREDAHALLTGSRRPQLLEMARELSVPGAGSKAMPELRREIVEATVGRRIDSVATRGFTGLRPGLGDVQGRPDLPTVGAPETPRTPPLSRRASGAGIATPSRMFSDVDSSVSEADRMLQRGDSPTVVSRFLRERAARVAKADINEEGRRFPVEIDKPTLLSIRKSNAEYLRRVATHVQQEGKASTPAKKAAKKAAPELPPPGEFLDLARAERPFTEPSPSRTGTSPVGGDRSTAPEIPNRWGAMGTGGDIEFHPDGVVGNGIKDMGDDRLMDVDGEPLSNKLGKLVTRMNHGEISMDQFIDELNRLAKRLPEGSQARQIVERMGPEIDAPKVKLDIPEGTPDVLARLARAMADNPLARGAVDRLGFRRDAENSELAKVMKMIEDFNAGRLAGVRFNQELQRIRSGIPHEANEGNAPILRALSEAAQEIQRIMNDPELRDQLARRTPGTPPAPKKATPRLTAIPGGGAGSRRKRPNLTVVRNENGEFSLVAVP